MHEVKKCRKVLPVVITVYSDKSFSFIIKPPAPVLLLEAAKLKSGSKEPNRDKVGSVNQDHEGEIAETKMPDLNAFTIESAMKMVAGTARSMGLLVKWHSSMGNSRQRRNCSIIVITEGVDETFVPQNWKKWQH